MTELCQRVHVRRAVICSALLLAVGLSVRDVRAELREREATLDAALGSFAPFLGQQTELELNGARLQLSTQVTPLDPAAVLERFERACSESAPRMSADLLGAYEGRAREIARALPQAFAGALPQAFAGALHERAAGMDNAVCFARAPDAGMAALLRAAHTRDLASFGQLRYVSVRPAADGGSHVLFAWNESALPIERMFAGDGDAAGSDLADIPRPVASRRVLSALVSGRAYGMVAYSLADTPHGALADYGATLHAHGFSELRVQPDAVADQTVVRAFMRGATQLIVNVFARDGGARLAIVRLADDAQHRTRGGAPLWGDSAASEEAQHVQ